MSTVFLAFVAVILCIFFRILNVNSVPLKPILSGKDLSFARAILDIVPLLAEPYIPTRLWGFSGHVQTVIHSAVGRLKCPLPSGHRTSLVLSDGSTLTYDTYPPIEAISEDVTIAVCPGIGNTSENVYIRTFVHYAQRRGYKIVVLNHIGALKYVRLTAPRIFSYGYTEDFHEMLCDVVKKYPETKIVAVGYSLGGNLVAKYLGEKRKRPKNIFAAVSICQGYSAEEGTKYLLNWQNFRRVYLYVLTEAVRNVILKHRYILLNESTKMRLNLNERDVIAAATLPELDEAFTRRMYGFNSVEEMYKWSSCCNYLADISVPMVFINAKDDPLIPHQLWTPAQQFACTHDQALFISVAHGGHLGFYEGGLVFPNPISWLDRAVVGLIGGLLVAAAPKELKT